MNWNVFVAHADSDNPTRQITPKTASFRELVGEDLERGDNKQEMIVNKYESFDVGFSLQWCRLCLSFHSL